MLWNRRNAWVVPRDPVGQPKEILAAIGGHTGF